MNLTINVVGTPAPQGSKRAFVVDGRAVMTESSKKVKPWRQDVVGAVRDLTDNPYADITTLPLVGPVQITIEFFLPRPGYHFGTGRNAGVLKATAPLFVDKKPDVDKLIRSTLDGLKEAGVYRDDAQVAAVLGVKKYADVATGARITLAPITTPVAELEQGALL